MNDDDLLRALGRIARENASNAGVAEVAGDIADDPRWDALCAGTLTPEEAEELRLEAMSSAIGRRAWEVFRTPEPGFRNQVVDGLQASRTDRLEATVDAAGDDADQAPLPVTARRRSVPSRRRRWLAPVGLAATVLLAVGLYRLGGGNQDGGDGRSVSAGAAGRKLPSYSLVIKGIEMERSADPDSSGSSAVLAPGSDATIILRPEDDALTRVDFLAFRRPESEGWEPWPALRDAAEVEFHDGGVIRVDLGEQPNLSPGRWELAFAVGRSDRLPSAGHVLELLARDRESDSEVWQLLRGDVKVLTLEEARQR